MWSERSGRSLVCNWAAALGCPKVERDFLGRWMASHSDDYTRTARQVVTRLQKQTAEHIRKDPAFIDEEHIVERIAARRLDRNMGGDVVEMRDRLGLAPLISAPKEDNTPVPSDEESEAPIAGVEIATEQAQEDERFRDQLGRGWGVPHQIHQRT